MNIVAATKGAIAVGWVLPGVAIAILFFPAPYRGGYEDRISDAVLLFAASVALMLGATSAALLLRRKRPEGLSKSWLAFSVAHLVAALGLVAYFAYLIRISS